MDGTVQNPYEAMADRYINGATGLKSYVDCELMGAPLTPLGGEMDGAVWTLRCLTNPENRADLDVLVRQSEMRRAAQPERTT